MPPAANGFVTIASWMTVDAIGPRPRVSQAASTDVARTLGAAGGVDLEAVLHLAHLHARGTQAPGWVAPLAWADSDRRYPSPKGW